MKHHNRAKFTKALRMQFPLFLW